MKPWTWTHLTPPMRWTAFAASGKAIPGTVVRMQTGQVYMIGNCNVSGSLGGRGRAYLADDAVVVAYATIVTKKELADLADAYAPPKNADTEQCDETSEG